MTTNIDLVENTAKPFTSTKFWTKKGKKGNLFT